MYTTHTRTYDRVHLIYDSGRGESDEMTFSFYCLLPSNLFTPRMLSHTHTHTSASVCFYRKIFDVLSFLLPSTLFNFFHLILVK